MAPRQSRRDVLRLRRYLTVQLLASLWGLAIRISMLLQMQQHQVASPLLLTILADKAVSHRRIRRRLLALMLPRSIPHARLPLDQPPRPPLPARHLP